MSPRCQHGGHFYLLSTCFLLTLPTPIWPLLNITNHQKLQKWHRNSNYGWEITGAQPWKIQGNILRLCCRAPIKYYLLVPKYIRISCNSLRHGVFWKRYVSSLFPGGCKIQKRTTNFTHLFWLKSWAGAPEEPRPPRPRSWFVFESPFHRLSEEKKIENWTKIGRDRGDFLNLVSAC